MGTLGRVIYVVGSWIRGAGQAVDRVGCALQGSHLLEEKVADFGAVVVFDEFKIWDWVVVMLFCLISLRSEIGSTPVAFELVGSFPPGCNSLFITLIPKSQEAKMVKEFRPISLIGSMYKIITKVLANRLSLVISELIQGCLNSAMGSILVNGSPTSEFKFFKGLKQGDPLSPFLFILIMESLHLSFNNVVNVGLYNGIQIDESLNLSHLFYADDVIFVGKWNSSNLSTIVNVLKWFYLASGLKINLNKSKLMGIGISHDVVASAAKSIGCSILHTPFNYLGVKVGGIMSRLSSWDDVIAKLSARLSKWKLKSLSIGGRLTLIKSVLSSLPLYYMSSFKVPKGVLSKMESIRRNFFNGVENAEKKMSLIGWNKILASKKNGGLGVSSFFAYNRALLFKWIWRFLANGASLWSRFISAIYGIRGALDNSSSYSRRSPWLDIVNEVRKLASKGIDLLSLVKKKVGNGEATSFWNDVWLGDFPLKQTYPRLYFLELDKHVSVASKLRANSLISSFRRSPRSGIEEEQLLLLISNTSSVILPNISDRWSWLLDPSGDFSVKSTREFIDDSMLPKTDVPTRWVKSIPIKINIFAWRVSLDKLPTRLNLSLRGLDIPSIICPLCSIAVESTSHLLFSCQLARQLMIKVVHCGSVNATTEHISNKRLYSVKRAHSSNFKVDEGILWIEISGLPLCAWGSNTYKKIACSIRKFLFFEKEDSSALSSVRNNNLLLRQKMDHNGDNKEGEEDIHKIIPQQPSKEEVNNKVSNPESKAESSDLSRPPGFEFMKKSPSFSSKCSTSFARYRKKDIKSVSLIHELNQL
ncbi:RNA-directed DNA polymerase, eukaryota [Tanacetum coccineum]